MSSLGRFISEKLGRKKLPWGELFRLFKEVMDGNNRALGVITDMGEKLGGDYLFDINYINAAYPKLTKALGVSMQRFTELTRGRYPGLKDAAARIDATITAAINETVPSSGRAVVFYEDIGWDIAREVGGKNANLSEVATRLKLKVPPAFAITTHAYDMLIQHNGLKPAIAALAGPGGDAEERLAAVRRSILAAEVPPALSEGIKNAVSSLKARIGHGFRIAVRSSAEEEDGEFSFAGQFKTVLNVPADMQAIEDAYRQVVASLFSGDAAAYMSSTGHEPGEMKMAAACVVQVDAAASGVMFSSSPDDPGSVMVNASWGLGSSVVDGTVEPDSFIIRKPGTPKQSYRIAQRKTGEKKSMTVTAMDGGTKTVPTPIEKAGMPCLTDEQLYALASRAAHIERHFGRPQDIEWAIDGSGEIYILQSRRMGAAEDSEKRPGAAAPDDAVVLMEGKGTVVQRGAGAGPVFIVNKEDDADKAPKGAVLVAKTDSSRFARVMPRLSAIVTDTGAPASHMASVCREFRVPAIVGTGDATKVLNDGQPVTVYIDEDGSARVYEGYIRGLVEASRTSVFGMESVAEYRKKKQILRYISPLHLVDPLMEEFTTEKCATVHDLLRFMHEKSVAELIEEARRRGTHAPDGGAVRVELPIPAALVVVDIGGGIMAAGGKRKVDIGQVSSLPLSSVLKGMTHPGVWHSETVSLGARDFLSSMVRLPDIRGDAESYVGCNLAVASREYVNLSLRFGYHFNMVDSYLSENARNNHIYFRFVGGATDIVKRSRRVNLIADVLKEYGFGLDIKGDLLIARLSNIERNRAMELLDRLGRLISYTRQLDAMLNTDEQVTRYTKDFLEGRYGY